MSLPVVIGILLIYVAIVVMTMYDAKRKCTESFIWNPDQKEMEGLKVYDEQPDKDGDRLLIHAGHTLYHVRLYTNGASRKVDFLKDILTDKEGIIVRLDSLESMSAYTLICENEAYMQCEIPITYHGKAGDVLPASYRFTWKAIVYFMLLGVAKYRP